MTINEASRLIGKSKQTLYRWRSEGCNIYDERALREYSDFMDIRSRGKSAQLAQDRAEPSISGHAFPGDAQKASHALAILEGLETVFKKRLEKAQKLGNKIETEAFCSIFESRERAGER